MSRRRSLLMAKAEAVHRELVVGGAIATNRKPHLLRPARLRYLAPDITAAILEGRQPVQLSARRLLRADTIPPCWQEQRQNLGFVWFSPTIVIVSRANELDG